MRDFIVNNYTIIIIVAAFLLFALIGFLVDQSKNSKSKESKILTEADDENKENQPEPIAVPAPETLESETQPVEQPASETQEPETLTPETQTTAAQTPVNNAQVIEIPVVDETPKDSK